MSATAVELIDLIARWIHVIAAIMWAGNSMLFNWIDRNLQVEQPAGNPGAPRAVGSIWLLHSGGFYHLQKSLLAGQRLPVPLHWFKWQAYTTWLSGMVLLVAVYYAGGRAVMADASVAALSHREAVAVGVGAIAGGWALYEALQRLVAPLAPRLATAAWVTGLAGIAFALTRLLNGRAAFLHAGAMLGTIMAANVFLTIIPSQRELVASVADGRGADPAVSARAKRVSVFNNYMTFPVIVLMVSSHFPSVYGNRRGGLLLLLLIAAGAAVRHILNVRFTFTAWRPALAATMLVSCAALLLVLRAGSAGAVDGARARRGPVTFAEAQHVIERRCVVCHSTQPADLTFGAAPAGVTFETPLQIVARAARIRERAVVTRTMPPANKTHITDGERELLGQWIAEGARR